MSKTKISTVDAYQGMEEVDFKVMDHEMESVFNSDQRDDREMTHQFFLEDGYIVLEMYWDETLVQTNRFKNKGVLSDKRTKM